MKKNIMVRIDEEYYNQLVHMASLSNDKNMCVSVLARDLIISGLSANILDTQKDMLRSLVRLAVEDALTPVANRLASISAKGSIMASSATFLQLVALNKIAGVSKDIIDVMYEEAKAQGYRYVRDSKPNAEVPED